MTTKAAEKLYLAQHEQKMEGKKWAVYNPHKKPLEDLPAIYGFNNGGSKNWYSGVLLAEDGTGLGGHICSAEGYMYYDLGILEGARPDRHETFRKHYPDGYRMVFIPTSEVEDHKGLDDACKKNQEQALQRKDAYESRMKPGAHI